MEIAASEMVLEARDRGEKLPSYQEVLASGQTTQTPAQAKSLAQAKPAKAGDQPSQKQTARSEEKKAGGSQAQTSQKPAASQAQKPASQHQPAKSDQKADPVAKGPFGPVGNFAPDGQTAATPLADRQGKANAQIVYSKEEVAVANQAGHYTTSDGYIFDARDIQDHDDFGVITGHMDHIHYIPFKDLSAEELAAAKAVINPQLEAEKEEAEDSKPALKDQNFDSASFDPKAVFAKLEKDGQVGYGFKKDGQDAFAPAKQLDLQDRAFAEQQLNLNSNFTYVYDIAPVKEGEMEPGLYVPVSQLPMRAGSASLDTGEFFVVPHIDHLHLVYYKDLSPEQIATIKYLMQHPDYRPAPWTDAGHDATTESAIKYIPNVTPENQREGMKNYQIIHSADEVNKALAEGNYATDEGYIFHPSDLLLNESYIYKKDQSWAIPRANGGRLMSFSKKDIPASMHPAVDEALAERDRLEAEKAKKDVSNRQLMDFLADYYGVGKRAVRFNFWDDTFTVPFDEAPNINITKEEALKAYFAEGDLPAAEAEKPASEVPAETEEEPAASQEAPAEKTAEPKPTEEPIASPEAPAQDEKTEAEKLLEELYKLPESTERGSRQNKEGNRHVEGDGLVFDPVEIERKTRTGYVIPHGDHYHMIPFSWLNDLEIQAAEAVLAEKAQGKIFEAKQPEADDQQTQSENTASESKPAEKTEKELALENWRSFDKKAKGKDGKPYDTSDGYVFEADTVVEIYDDSFLAAHGDHFHFVYYSELEDEELVALADFWFSPAGQEKAKEAQAKKEQEQAALSGRDLEPRLAMDPMDLPHMLMWVSEDRGTSFVVPHGDHFHYYDYANLSDEVIQTTKYLIQNPDERPKRPEGYIGYREEGPAPIVYEGESEAEIYDNMDKFIAAYAEREGIDEGDLWDQLFEISAYYEFQIDRADLMPGKVWRYMVGDQAYYYDLVTGEYISDNAEAEAIIKAAEATNPPLAETEEDLNASNETPEEEEAGVGFKQYQDSEEDLANLNKILLEVLGISPVEDPDQIIVADTDPHNFEDQITVWAEEYGMTEDELWDALDPLYDQVTQVDQGEFLPNKIFKHGDRYFDLANAGQEVAKPVESVILQDPEPAEETVDEPLDSTNPAEESLDPEEERIAKAAEAFGYPDMDAFYDNLIPWALKYKVSVGDMDFNTADGTITLNSQTGETRVIDALTGELIEDSSQAEEKPAEAAFESPETPATPAPENEESQPVAAEEKPSPAEEPISEESPEEDEEVSGAAFPIFKEDADYSDYLHKKMLVDLGLLPAEELEPFIIEAVTEEPEPTESVLTNEGPYGPVGEFAPDGKLKATPLAERAGKENWQIVYSKEEVDYANSKGITTTSDGYIFKATDITSFDGFGYVTPHMDHIHYTPAYKLSETERKEAEEFWAANKDRLETANKPNSENSTGQAEDAGDQTEKSADQTEQAADAKPLTLRQRYDAAEAKLIVPVDQLTGSTKYTTALTSDYKLIMPHHDHYHYLAIEELDGLYGVEGYTTDEIFSTIKYMIDHPEARPQDGSGWGSSAEIAQAETEKATDTKPESQASDTAEETKQDQVAEETTSEATESAENAAEVEAEAQPSQTDPAHLYDDAWDVPTSGIHIERFNGVTEREFYSDGTVGLIKSDDSKVYYNGLTGEVVNQPLAGAIQLEL